MVAVVLLKIPGLRVTASTTLRVVFAVCSEIAHYTTGAGLMSLRRMKQLLFK